MARKKQEMDNLSMDSVRCMKDGYGFHYGDWKALHPHTKYDTPPVNDGKTKPCWICGRPIPLHGMARKYCSEECAYTAKKMRDKESELRRKERQKDGETTEKPVAPKETKKIPITRPAVAYCLWCGSELLHGDMRIRYCDSGPCRVEGRRKRDRESHRRKKMEAKANEQA